MLGKNQIFEFELNGAETDALQELKERFFRHSLPFPLLRQKQALNINAWEYSALCLLLQKQLNDGKLSIGYWSTSLFPPGKNYSTTEKNFLAVLRSILTLLSYLEEATLTMRTDHHPLKCTFNLANSSRRLAQRRLRLPERDSEVQY